MCVVRNENQEESQTNLLGFWVTFYCAENKNGFSVFFVDFVSGLRMQDAPPSSEKSLGLYRDSL